MRRRTDPGVRLFALLARVFPERGRGTRAELVDAFEAGYLRRREKGMVATVRYLVRASWDVLCAGLAERWRRPAGGGVLQRRIGGGGRMFGDLWWDVRHGARVLAKSPGFTAAVVVVLALGIGANTAVFSALHTVLLAPAPYPEAERLVFPKITWQRPGDPEPRHLLWSYPKYEELLAGTGRIFEEVGGYATRTLTLTGTGDPARLEVEIVTPSYLALAGVRPVLGRVFTAEEADPAVSSPVVLVGDELWSSRLGGRPDAVGETVVLEGRPVTVVGVLPPGFHGLTGEARAWIPTGTVPALLPSWFLEGAQAHWIQVLARLAPGVTLDAAQARMRQVGEAIEEAMPLADPGDRVGATVQSFTEVRRNPAARTSVLVLMAAAGLVLLIALANLAGLLLARGHRRSRETAVRLALGSGRWRLVRARVVEALLLAALGCLVGLIVARWGIDGIAAAWPDTFLDSAGSELRVVNVSRLGLDVQVLLFAAGISLLGGVVAGAVPALRQSVLDLVPALKEGGTSTRRSGSGLRRALVGGQMAVALVLLVGAGLMVNTLVALQSVDRGFDPEDLLVFRYNVDGAGADPWTVHDAVRERLRALPGVRAVAVGTDAPLSGWGMVTTVSGVEGAPPIPPGEREPIGVIQVGPRWFDALGARIVAGRGITEADATFPPDAVVLSRTAARQFFGDRSPLGLEIEMGISFGDEENPYRVVGVAEDILHGRPERDRFPTAYLPLAATGTRRATVMVRTDGEPLDMLPSVRAVVRAIDPELPLYRITTAQALDADAVGDTRVVLSLLALFAALALALAATGVYGIVAYSVAARRRELGLRIALGARAADVARLVLGQGAATAGVGAAIGLAGAWIGTRMLSSLLYGVGAHDAGTFVACVATLVAVAALASWLPARRATRLDPAEVLRNE